MRDALQRAWMNSAEIGSFAITADPKDVKAAAFYRKFGFQNFAEQRMFVAMEEVGRWLNNLTNG